MLTTIRNVTIEANTAPIDFCLADSIGVVDIFLMDLDGSLSPERPAAQAPSALVSDNPNMLAFVDQAKCRRQAGRCYSYCEGVCFRSVQYETSPSETETYKLKVCQKGNLNTCIFIAGYLMDDEASDLTQNRIFRAHLPPGEYLAVFVNQQGTPVWPSFVETKYETPLCPNAFADGAIVLQVPAMDRNSLDPFQSCKHLVRNGGLEASDIVPRFWLARQGGLTLTVNGGKGGSRAATANATDGLSTILQYVDSRCVEALEGQFYKMKAEIKLSPNVSTTTSSWLTCNPSMTKCPELGLFSEDFGYLPVATVALAVDQYGFQMAEGFVKITNNIVQASAVAVYVRSNVNGMFLTMDSVVVSKVEDASVFCKDLVQYSNFADPMAFSLWGPSFSNGKTNGVVRTTSPGYNQRSTTALLYSGRSDVADGPSYKAFRNIDTECLRPGSSWTLVAQLKLVDKTNNRLGGMCDPKKINDCPSAFLTILNPANGLIFKGQWRTYPDVWNATNFNKLLANFTLPSDTNANSSWDSSSSIGGVKLDFRNSPVQFDIVVGSVVLTRTG